MSVDTVKIYNPDTGLTTVIPAAELSPEMVRATVEGVGEVYVRRDALATNDEPHDLPDGFEEIALEAWNVLRPRLTWMKGEDDWLSPFRADQHPVRELMLWMWVAAVYQEATHGGTDSESICLDVFKVLVSAMTQGRHALETVELQRISQSRAKQVLALHQASDHDVKFVEFWHERVDLERLLELRKAESS